MRRARCGIQTASENVVACWQRKHTMAHPTIRDVIEYWDRLRASRDVPNRSDIDTREISEVLSYTFILDRARPDAVRFRLSGTHVNELMGLDVRGMPFHAVFELSERKSLMEHVETVFTGPCRLDLGLISDAEGRAPLDGWMALLPLRNIDGEISRALGVLVTEGVIGQPPRRFRLRRTNLTPLRAGRPALGTQYDGASGLAEAPAPWTPPPPITSDKRPILRVVKGGKD